MADKGPTAGRFQKTKVFVEDMLGARVASERATGSVAKLYQLGYT